MSNKPKTYIKSANEDKVYITYDLKDGYSHGKMTELTNRISNDIVRSFLFVGHLNSFIKGQTANV